MKNQQGSTNKADEVIKKKKKVLFVTWNLCLHDTKGNKMLHMDPGDSPQL